MEGHDIVAVVAIAGGAVITTANIIVNGDGVSIVAFFTLVGTVLGYAFGAHTKEATSNA